MSGEATRLPATPIRDTFYFPHPQDCISGTRPRVSSVAIASGPFVQAGVGVREKDLNPAGEIDGHRVLESEVVCELSDPGACTQSFAVPDLDAYFHVTIWSQDGGEAVVRRIRQSLALADIQQSIVPFVPWGTEAEFVAALEEVGLEVQIERTTCPPPPVAPRG